MAKYNVTTNYGTKKGTNAADTFNVYGYENSVYGKGGKDIINVYGKENTVYGDSGADRITVFKGGNSWSSHTIYGGSGNDIFVVKKNKSIYANLYGGAGNDKFTVNGGSSVSVYGDSRPSDKKKVKGNDTITFSNVSFAYADGGAGNDSITVNGGTKANGYLYGGAGNDTIKIHAGSFQVEGGAGNDTIILDKKAKSQGGYESVNTQIYGDAGKDTITVTSGKNFFGIDGGTGNDKISVSGGKRHKIYGGTGNDVITLKNSTHYNTVYDYYDGTKKTNIYKTEVYGGAGNDTIKVSGGSYNKVIGDYAYSSSGNAIGHDTIFVKSGTNHEIFTGWGNDKVFVSGGSNIFIKNGINESHMYVPGNDARCDNDQVEISGGKNITFIGSGGTYDGKEYGADTVIISGGTGLDISTNDCADTITISGGTGKVDTGSGKDKVTFNWTNNVGDYFIAADKLLDDRIVINNAKSSDFIATRDIYTPLGYIDTTLGGHDYLIFTHKTTGATITLTGWSSGDETTYGAYFTGDKKIVFSTPGQSPMVEAARKTPGYSG